MAKQTILKERGTGEVLYPQTLASLVQTADGGNVDEELDKAKFALFVDMWNQAWGAYGKYDPANAPDAEHPFMGNGLWMTYEEALGVYRYSSNFGYTREEDPLVLRGKMRTNIPIFHGTLGATLGSIDANELEVVRLVSAYPGSGFTLLGFTFYNKPKLKQIIGPFRLRQVAPNNFGKLFALEEFELVGLNFNLSLPDSALLSLSCVSGWVTNAANTTAITITVHADVYAKLTGDTTNEAAAALTEEEAADWYQVLTDAAEKNITFATP